MATPIPNWIAAFLVRTREFPDVVALTGQRITAARYRTYSPQDPAGWKMPTYGIVYRSIAGPSKREFQAPIRWQPLQVEVYGPDARTSDELWRTLYPNLMPQDMTKAHGFVVRQLGVSIMSIEELGAPFTQYEAPPAWPRTIATLYVQFNEMPHNIVSASASLGAQSGM